MSIKRFLHDYHVHTNFSYCADDNMEPAKIIEQAKMFPISQMAFTDHAGQLYVSSENYWSGRIVNNPNIINENLDTELNRMKQYKKYMERYRSDKILLVSNFL